MLDTVKACKFFEVDVKTVELLAGLVQVDDDWKFNPQIKTLDNISLVIFCDCNKLVKNIGSLHTIIQVFYSIYSLGLCKEAVAKNIKVSNFDFIVLKPCVECRGKRVGVAFDETNKLGYIIYDGPPQ